MNKPTSEAEQIENYIKTANVFAESKEKSFGAFENKWEWLITRIYLEAKQAGYKAGKSEERIVAYEDGFKAGEVQALKANIKDIRKWGKMLKGGSNEWLVEDLTKLLKQSKEL